MAKTEKFTTVSEASFSDCGNFRYWLSRIWDNDKLIGAFICMNPSKATSLKLDLTVMNITNLAVDWGWGGYYVVNLSGIMETDSKLVSPFMNQAVEKDNDKAIQWVTGQTRILVAAWGAEYHGSARAQAVQNLLSGHTLYCIDHTKNGAPLHAVNVHKTRKHFPSPIKL